jgi:Bacterial membrane protein YfhO
MASKKRERKEPAPSGAPASNTWDWLASPRTIILGLAAAVLLFYFKPLFSGNATIQWDAVDVQYSAQNHLSEMLHSGKLPQWTPYVFSGMPFLADPQVGAWYPLNWPFFLAGITPRAIEWQLALHCLLAAIGGYLLACDLLRSRAAAVFAGMFFAFSGVFAAHSSHPGIFQASSLAPWLLWTARRAARETRWLPALGMAAGAIVLVGHFQTALYAFFALAIFLAADFAIARVSWHRGAFALLVAVVAGALLSAVMVLPGLELTGESIRAGADYSKDAGASLTPGALATLVSPDHYGALDPEHYTGPQDITQFYLYMGILLVPLALLGLTAARERWYGLALLVPGAWYALGPAGGLYSLVSMLPAFRSVRAPVHMWFVAALGLALLAAAGVGVLRARYRSPWMAIALLAVTGLDLYYWNMERNGLAYARESFQDRYGSLEDRFRTVSAPLTSNPLHRIWAANASPSFGPLNGSLDNRMEATFGYNPLELARYSQYLEAATANPKLLNGLAVTATLNSANGVFSTNPAALPRIYAPETVSAARTRQEAAARLGSLDPAREAVVEATAAIAQNGGAKAQITGYEGDVYRARYQADHATLLRIAAPYFPGWQAEVDGKAVKVVPVDVALMGVVVPAGDHELVVRYRSTWFATGAAISGITWLGAILWLWWGFRRRVV